MKYTRVHPVGLHSPEPADQAALTVSMVSGAPLEILVGKQHRRAFCCGNTPYLDLDGSYTRVNLLKNSFSCCALYCIFLTLELKFRKRHRPCPQPTYSPVWATVLPREFREQMPL